MLYAGSFSCLLLTCKMYQKFLSMLKSKLLHTWKLKKQYTILQKKKKSLEMIPDIKVLSMGRIWGKMLLRFRAKETRIPTSAPSLEETGLGINGNLSGHLHPLPQPKARYQDVKEFEYNMRWNTGYHSVIDERALARRTQIRRSRMPTPALVLPAYTALQASFKDESKYQFLQWAYVQTSAQAVLQTQPEYNRFQDLGTTHTLNLTHTCTNIQAETGSKASR